MAVTHFDHIYVETHRFDAAVRFWTALGFNVAESWGEGDYRACLLKAERASVVLAQAKPSQSPQRSTVHFAISQAESLDAALRSNPDVKVVTALEPTHWGTRWIRVVDPDGNLYCLEARNDTTQR